MLFGKVGTRTVNRDGYAEVKWSAISRSEIDARTTVTATMSMSNSFHLQRRWEKKGVSPPKDWLCSWHRQMRVWSTFWQLSLTGFSFRGEGAFLKDRVHVHFVIVSFGVLFVIFFFFLFRFGERLGFDIMPVILTCLTLDLKLSIP